MARPRRVGLRHGSAQSGQSKVIIGILDKSPWYLRYSALHGGWTGVQVAGGLLPRGPPATTLARATQTRPGPAMTPTPAIQRTGASAAPLLVFDFDGVLCDSLEECMMVAWYAHAGESLERFVAPGLDGVPTDVVQRFEVCRPFMRHLGHFFVALVDRELPSTHDEFAARYDALAGDASERFVRAAEAYRAGLRAEHASAWRARHAVETRLGPLAGDGYVATARDHDSVSQILGGHGIAIPGDRVFGSLRDKTRALRLIAQRESLAPRDVVLVDDSIQNCIAAREAGFAAYWASWGYHADGDAGTAVAHGIPVMTVQALLRVKCATLS